jgi:hypothetical protein
MRQSATLNQGDIHPIRRQMVEYMRRRIVGILLRHQLEVLFGDQIRPGSAASGGGITTDFLRAAILTIWTDATTEKLLELVTDGLNLKSESYL